MIIEVVAVIMTAWNSVVPMLLARKACIVIVRASSDTWSMLNPVRYAVLLFCPSPTRDPITVNGFIRMIRLSIKAEMVITSRLGVLSSAPIDTKNIAEKKSLRDPVVSRISML